MENSCKLSLARWLTWLSYGAFIITLFFNALLRDAPLMIYAITLLPLLIFIPGMLKEHYKSYSMLCFVCLMYFTVITVNLFKPEPSVWDVMEMVWVCILFISAMMFSRWKQRSLL
ncbi:DUF2069 domain-containing protein [Porticoccaceae bacterium LTM1]|nr:DUF2069 domain-containing protein [Porticoccaceae bacterium LTM1]